jgi:hypothetical protein
MFPRYSDWNIAYTSPYARLKQNAQRMWSFSPLALVIVSFCWMMLSGMGAVGFAKSILQIILAMLKHGIEWVQSLIA